MKFIRKMADFFFLAYHLWHKGHPLPPDEPHGPGDYPLWWACRIAWQVAR
jgi:hypothetical protein